jgi:hypothetical protein
LTAAVVRHRAAQFAGVIATVIPMTVLVVEAWPASAATAPVVCGARGPVCDRVTTPLSDIDAADPSIVQLPGSSGSARYEAFSSADEYAGTEPPSADNPARDDITREPLIYRCHGSACTWTSGESRDAVTAPPWDRNRCPMQAPGVFKAGSGYVMWFDMADANAPESCLRGPFLDPPPTDTPYYCLYYATASSLTGSWRIPDTSGVVCSADGAIDPEPFSRDGLNYLLWKDGNVTGGPASTIQIGRLDAAGTRLVPGSTEVLASQASISGPPGTLANYVHVSTLEAPAPIFTSDGDFFLLFAAGNWKTSGYEEGIIDCGPWVSLTAGSCNRTPFQNAPLLATRSFAPHTNLGPGSATSVETPDHRTWIAYDAWEGCVGYWNTAAGCPFGQRRVFIARLRLAAL